MTDINHRRHNRPPVSRRYATTAYRNGFAQPEKAQGPLRTTTWDEERQCWVVTTHRSRTGNTDFLDKSMHGWGRRAPLADRYIAAGISNDFCNGHRGMARAVRGAKKFVRSRVRFHENVATRRHRFSTED